MNTIVSAFVSNINNRDDITLKRYYELSKLLLKSTVPKIFFVDETMFNLINLLDYDISNTNIVKIEKKGPEGGSSYYWTLQSFFASQTLHNIKILKKKFRRCK